MTAAGELFRLVRLVGGHGGGGLAAVFVCYLDDSDSEQSSVLTLAGYVQPLAEWERFEEHAARIYADYRVDILHAKEFHGTKDDFSGWSYKKKTGFIDDLYAGFPQLCGISYSIRKATHKARAKQYKGFASRSPYGMVFNQIVTFLGRNENMSDALDEQGLSFVVESGHNNNEEVEHCFHGSKVAPFFKGRLRSITFSGKTESRAIQLADMLAFYSRRAAARLDKYSETGPTQEQVHESEDKIYTLITSQCNHFSYTVTDAWGGGSISIEDYESGNYEIDHEHSPILRLPRRRPDEPI